MIIRNLNVRNVRNLHDLDLTFDDGFQVLVGRNGQGKTNLLEAIGFLSALKSFRGSTNRDVIAHGAEQAIIEAEVHRGASFRTLRIEVKPGHRRILINGDRVARLRDFFGMLTTVVFVPGDITVVNASPGQRRLFFDRMVFNLWPSFAEETTDWDKALKNRNRELKADRPDPAMLDVYDEQLAVLGARIVVRRFAFVRQVREAFQATFHRIFDPNMDVALRYVVSSVEVHQDATLNQVEALLGQKLKENRARDLIVRHTTVGPHRDDFEVDLQGVPVKRFASQGQQRAIVLALKITEIQTLKQVRSIAPVLLLDDVSSELDPVRNELLFDYLSEIQSQVFLTTTDMRYVSVPDPFTRWSVSEGLIST